MASTFLRDSNQHVAVIVGDKRITRSLKTTCAKTAEKTGAALQRLADKAKTATQRQLLRLCEDVLDAANVPVPWEKAETGAVRFSAFAADWIDRKGRSGAKSSLKVAIYVTDSFALWCKDSPMSQITGSTIQAFYDSLIASNLAASTANARLDNLAALFRHAHNLGVIAVNPAKCIERLDSTSVAPREALPDEAFGELMTHLGFSDAADASSWITAAMLGRFAGLRLGDAANLPTKAVSVVEGQTLLSYLVTKTGRTETVPVLHPPLCERLAKLPVGDFCCPALAGKPMPRLSRRFSDLLIAAGIVSPVITTGSGRLHRSLSFHSLRHSFVSSLSKMGIPQHLAMKLSGHSNAKINSGYDHSTAVDLAKQLAQFLKP